MFEVDAAMHHSISEDEEKMVQIRSSHQAEIFALLSSGERDLLLLCELDQETQNLATLRLAGS